LTCAASASSFSYALANTPTPLTTAPFHLADVKLFIGNRRLDLHNDPDADLQAAIPPILARFINFTNAI
jgi:hypothetical protein